MFITNKNSSFSTFFTTFSNCLFEQKHVSSGFKVNFRSKTPLIFLFPKVAKLCYFLLGSNSERLYTQWEKTAGVKETQKEEENVKWFSYQVMVPLLSVWNWAKKACIPSKDQIHNLKRHMHGASPKTRGKAMVRTMHSIYIDYFRKVSLAPEHQWSWWFKFFENSIYEFQKNLKKSWM